MNEGLSIWSLISEASVPVQLVMLLLVAASLASWVIIFQRLITLRAAHEEFEHFEGEFWSGENLRVVYQHATGREDGVVHPGAEQIFVAGFREFTRLSTSRGIDPELVMQGVARAMRVVLVREDERLSANLSFLATVGSTSPYIGLFGTVWGIMNSFRELATVSQASLATVAPGISEALIATAIGLFAAIPAVVGYNRFSASVGGLMNRYDSFADEFASILQRNLVAQVQRS